MGGRLAAVTVAVAYVEEGAQRIPGQLWSKGSDVVAGAVAGQLRARGVGEDPGAGLGEVTADHTWTRPNSATW
jgi:hypothetical protein